MNESAIERAVCAYAKAKGCIVMKLSGQNQRGQPDRLFVRDGRVLFVEFKAPGKRPTALQERWISDLRRQGMFATSCDNIEKGKGLINFFLL